MMPSVKCPRGLLLGLAAAVFAAPALASEKAIITPPAKPSTQPVLPTKPQEDLLPFRSLKSGDSTGGLIDIPAPPSLPTLTPAAQRLLLERLDREKNWLLDDQILESDNAASALEDSLNYDSGRSSLGLVERSLRGGTDRPSEEFEFSEDGVRNNNPGSPNSRTTGRNEGRVQGEDPNAPEDEDGFGVKSFSSRRGAPVPGEVGPRDAQEMNPFMAIQPQGDFDKYLAGEQSGLVPRKLLDNVLDPVAKSWETRVERFGETFGGAMLGGASGQTGMGKDFTLRAEEAPKIRELRVDQFDRAFGGGFKGLEATQPAAVSSPLAPPDRANALFDTAAPSFSLPAASPLAAPTRSPAMDFLREARPAIQPLPRPVF